MPHTTLHIRALPLPSVPIAIAYAIFVKEKLGYRSPLSSPLPFVARNLCRYQHAQKQETLFLCERICYSLP